MVKAIRLYYRAIKRELTFKMVGIMNDKIELRDIFAAQLMSGKVNDFYSQAYRENVSQKQGDEEWVQVLAEEATRRAIERAANNAYVIADALLKARG